MKITKKHNDGLTAFANLASGDIFLYENNYYLRIDTIELDNGDELNAVRLDTGDTCTFTLSDRVKVVNAELIVEV